MNKMPFFLQDQFYGFYNNEIAIDDFAEWIYGQNEVEKYLSNDHYIALISLDFKSRHIKHEMVKIINSYLDFGRFEELKLRRILNDLISRSDNLASAIVETYDLYCLGYSFFEELGMNYGLVIGFDSESVEWMEKSDNQKKVLLDKIYDGVKREAELVLKWLNMGKIILTGEVDDIGHYEYVDKRDELERERSIIPIIEVKESKRKKFIVRCKKLLKSF